MNVKVTEQMATMALKLEVGSILPNFCRLILAIGLEEEEAESVLEGTAGKDCILEDDARPGEEEEIFKENVKEMLGEVKVVMTENFQGRWRCV